MTIGTGNFAELLWPGIADMFGLDYEAIPALYPKVFETKRATKLFEKIQGVTGLPTAGIKTEGGTVPSGDPAQGFQKEFKMVVYGMQTSITREMVEDEQYNYIREIPGMLSRSIRDAEETTAWNHFNRVANGAYLGPDGIVLGSASHVTPTGLTYSNILATPSDLAQTSLETMLQMLLDFDDDQGIPIRLQPKVLVVPTGLVFTARKLLESTYVVGRADNDINPIPGLFSDLVVSPYLTDTDAWGIVTNAKNGLIFMRRRDTEIDRDNEFDTQNLKIQVTGRWDSGWADPRGLVWTVGA